METNSRSQPRRSKFDLEERLLDYAAGIIRLVESLPSTRAGNHVAGQLLRSGTSALPNHGEAQAAESANDFIHKMKLSLKEPHESMRWLRLIRRVPLLKSSAQLDVLIRETDELIRIFFSSIETAQKNSSNSRVTRNLTAPSLNARHASSRPSSIGC